MKGVFSRSCCYGNLLCHENNTNVFTSDWAVFLKSGNYDPSKSTSWKVLETVLSHLKPRILHG